MTCQCGCGWSPHNMSSIVSSLRQVENIGLAKDPRLLVWKDACTITIYFYGPRLQAFNQSQCT